MTLKGAGIVTSRRGATGGYVLSRDPSQITLAQIISAVDGPLTLGDFGAPHENGACEHEGQCVLRDVWAQVGSHMREHLRTYTLADMVDRARGMAPGASQAAGH